MSKQSFFLFLLLILIIPIFDVYGDTVATANLLPPGQQTTANDEFILDNNETLDLSETVVTVTETTETIGGVQVNLTQEVQFIATQNNVVTIENISLPTVTIEIPDETIVSGPTAWDNTITPPTLISTSGTVTAGFQTPTTSISVGSPDVILVFDSTVTLLLEGTTGQTAYKLPGTSNWVLISTCTGTFANPDDPPINGECSISNEVDTKILTFHFTEFAGLDEISSAVSGGGGGGGDETEPTLQSNLLSSPDSNIYGGTLKLDDSAKNSASIFETGDTVDLELSFYENSGTESLAHVTLFTNIRDNDDRYDSNLYVEWNKGKPLKVYDYDGYLNDTTSVSFAKHDSNIVMIFHLNFIKPMDVSHIVLNFWDYNRNNGLVTFNDAWRILEPVDITIPESENDDVTANNDTVNEFIDMHQKEEPPTIPAWVKNNARWWADGKIEDSIFTNGIQHMLQIRGDISNVVNTSTSDEFGITSEEKRIPNWIKNSAKWWSEDLVSEDEFVNALQWLISKEIIKF